MKYHPAGATEKNFIERAVARGKVFGMATMTAKQAPPSADEDAQIAAGIAAALDGIDKLMRSVNALRQRAGARYLAQEYGIDPAAVRGLNARVKAEVAKERRAGKVRAFDGSLDSLLAD